MHHLNVKSAFFNFELQEDVYVSQLEGFVKENQEHLEYKLVKLLYGLRQAPRAWYAKLNKCLESLGFTNCFYEHAFYTICKGDKALVIGVYVKDLLIDGTNISNINRSKK